MKSLIEIGTPVARAQAALGYAILLGILDRPDPAHYLEQRGWNYQKAGDQARAAACRDLAAQIRVHGIQSVQHEIAERRKRTKTPVCTRCLKCSQPFFAEGVCSACGYTNHLSLVEGKRT